MPECQNCGEFVSETYVRVRARDQLDGVHCCPHCPDRIWDGSKIREARSVRRSGNADWNTDHSTEVADD
jgi:hypothetical protein